MLARATPSWPATVSVPVVTAASHSMEPAPLTAPTLMLSALMTLVPAPRNSREVPPELLGLLLVPVMPLFPTPMTSATIVLAVEERRSCASGRVPQIAVGFVAAFVSAVLVVRPFLAFVRRRGFAPFAWYRIAVGLVLLAVASAG